MRLIDADALIKEYEEILEKTLADFCETERMMCREVIRALQNAPTIEPIEDTKSCGVSADKSADQNVADVPSGDFISRADAIEAVDGLKERPQKYYTQYNNALSDAVLELTALPSADRPITKDTQCQEKNDHSGEVTEMVDLISRADAIDSINKTNSTLDEIPICKDIRSAFANAIKALPSAEPSGDLISRADALEQMAQAECGLHYEDCEADKCYCSYIQRILDLPTADRPQVNSNSAEEQIAETCDRPKGEWIGEGDGYADGEIVYDTWYCSKCDHCEEGEELALPNFCPNCGARMKGEADGDL